MSHMSHGAKQRTVRVVIFLLAMGGAWSWYGTHISAEEAREILLHDLNEP